MPLRLAVELFGSSLRLLLARLRVRRGVDRVVPGAFEPAELVREGDQLGSDLPVVRLTRGQAEPDRETLRVDDDVDLGRESAP